MKKLICILILILSVVSVGECQNYLSQPVPGSTPSLFAPGIVSTKDQTEFGSIFSKDGTEFYFAAEPLGKAEIRFMKLEDGKWTTPKTILSHNEYSYNDPFLSPDERKLFFISNMPLNGVGEKKDYDIWYVDRMNDGWSKPVNAGENINSPGNEYYMSFTKTGTMYFSSNGNATDEKKSNYDIYSSKSTAGGFQPAIKLSDAINTPNYEADVFVDPEEKYLIFCANRPDGNGKGDLYISFKKVDGTWAAAKNLGKEINAELTEYCPFVTADRKYFFYTKSSEIYWVDAKILDAFR